MVASLFVVCVECNDFRLFLNVTEVCFLIVFIWDDGGWDKKFV